MKTVIETATVKLVLEALEAATRYGAGGFEDAKDALRVALAEQPAQQEPVSVPDCGEAGHADGACGEWRFIK